MEWSQEDIIKLIDAYRGKSLLWDLKHKDHFKKPLKEDAWRDIEAEMKVPADQCKKKVLSCLSSYRREKSKMKKSQGTGIGRDDIYVSRWFAYDAFQFLEDRDEPRKRVNTEMDMDNTPLIVGETEAEDNSSAQSPVETTPSSSKPNRDNTTKRTKRAEENMMGNALSILKNAASKLDSDTGKPDELDSFFTYVATKAKKYSSHKQTAVQHAVFDIIMKADRGYYECNSWQNSQQSEQYVLQPLQTVPPPFLSPNSLSNISGQPSPSESILSENFSDFV